MFDESASESHTWRAPLGTEVLERGGDPTFGFDHTAPGGITVEVSTPGGTAIRRSSGVIAFWRGLAKKVRSHEPPGPRKRIP